MTDLRLAAPVAGAWLAALVGGRLPTEAWVAGSVVLCLVATWAACRTPPWRARAASTRWTVVATSACAAAAVIAAGARNDAVDSGPLRALAAREAEVVLHVVVTGDPVALDGGVVGARRTGGVVRVEARAELVAVGESGWRLRHPVLVLASGEGWRQRLPGERLRLDAQVSVPRPGDPYAAVARARGAPQRLAGPGPVQRAAGRLRAGLREASARLPGDAAQLLPGLVIGDTSRLSAELREDFRATGLSHLLAVSGSNAAIFLGFALLVARRAGASVPVTVLVGALALAGFVVLARPSPSVLRAAVMGGIGLLALVTGRARAGPPALAGAVLVLLLADPSLASTPGFALSVAATGGLVVLAPRWRVGLARRWPRWLADAVAVPLAAQVACLPILVGLFGELSLVAVPANLVAMPAVGLATTAGVLTAVLAPLAMPLARAVALVAALPASYLGVVARSLARVPAARIPWPAGLRGAFAIGVALAALWACWRIPALRRVLVVVLPLVLVTSIGARVVLRGWPPPGWVFVACDVGQGDGLVVRSGTAVVVVDTGPDPAAMDRCLDRLGVDHVSAVVLTHMHADHVEGLPGVLSGRDVAEVVVGPLEEPAEEWARVRRWVGRAELPLRRANAGESWRVGTVTVTVLAPAAAFRGTASDPNNSSLVLAVVADGLRLLLTGDIEQPAQQAVIDSADPDQLRADVLKVAHHGSDRQLDGFAERVGASVAVTSVGADNPYGHPSGRTLGSLRRLGSRSWRTDRDGDVAVGWHEGRRYAVGRGRSAVRAVIPRRGSPGRWAAQIAPAPPALYCRVPEAPGAGGPGPRGTGAWTVMGS